MLLDITYYIVYSLEVFSCCRARATLALEECIQTISPILAIVENRLSLNKLSNFGANVVYVTMSDEKEIEAFKSAAGNSLYSNLISNQAYQIYIYKILQNNTPCNYVVICDVSILLAKVRVIYESHGLPSTDQREAKPHVTLFKTRYGMFYACSSIWFLLIIVA